MNRDRGLYGQSNMAYGESMAIAALAKNLTTYLIVAHNDKVVRDAMNNLPLVSLYNSCTASPDQADSIPRIDPISELSEASLRGHFPVSLDKEGIMSGSAPMHAGKTYRGLDEIMMSEMIVVSETLRQAMQERLL